MRPSPILRDLTLGVLARAARLYPVEIHAFVFLSNHFHVLLTVPDARRLALFMGYLNSNLAREAGRLVRWREKFWGRRYQAIVVSSEEGAQVGRLRYLLSHGSKEGLVYKPRDWPGAHSIEALLAGEPIIGRWIDRTLDYKASRKGILLGLDDLTTEESLTLAPIPCWRHLTPETYRRRIAELVEVIEAESERRFESSGRAPAGRILLQGQNPHHQPNRIKKAPAPLVHAISRQIRHEFREAYRLFASAYRIAAERLRMGETDVSFPRGSFPPSMPFEPLAASG